jgi:hypothetical protein
VHRPGRHEGDDEQQDRAHDLAPGPVRACAAGIGGA